MDFALPLVILVIFVFIILNRQKAKKAAAENIEAGTAFLDKNAQEEGVMTTASGLQYKVLEQGEGEAHPTAKSRVKVHYHGTLLDGTVFDSSVQRGEPIDFGLNQVIRGWTEGVQLMKKGEKTRFFIPSHLAYGNGSAGAIKPGSTLIFEVELLDFN
ncbi:peptidylprolyl isomerase [Enterovibrio norvegicus FF-162]|uniref:FKBP-type peptidyl-prolyl cis-trans isomerase n=1 Tax=Enterovibrio TaxID=188143 RepID=UPI000316DF76|nr:FKBP-type peptidyl-prolyl cis-trans isomerase [Enterovibrio norvegicus]OEE82403.1 peptidylprolyl isomerase [Enterovibrio norvegicus FF-162]